MNILSIYQLYRKRKPLFQNIFFLSKDIVSANAFHRPFKIVANGWKLSKMSNYLKIAAQGKLFLPKI